jgi:hypothetical protein
MKHFNKITIKNFFDSKEWWIFGTDGNCICYKALNNPASAVQWLMEHYGACDFEIIPCVKNVDAKLPNS